MDGGKGVLNVAQLVGGILGGRDAGIGEGLVWLGLGWERYEGVRVRCKNPSP